MQKIPAHILLSTLLVLALTACSGPSTPTTSTAPPTKPVSPAVASLQLDVADYPRMDGSTANMPLMAEVMSRVCNIPLSEAQNATQVTTTPLAWANLANGHADILLVYEAAAPTKVELESIGTPLEAIAIGRDGLVFLGNEANAVSDLSTAQLQGIYTGNITNWQEVGGANQAIVAYQRSADSGSQALFMKLLMPGLTPTEPPHTLRPGGMGELIDNVASYNNTGDAIGYSVYYYASQMYQQPGLKLFSVDGITPTTQTIGDGSYPFINEFFVVIRQDAPADSPARALRDWIISPEGIQTLIDTGYVAIQ